ncbi:MAG: type II toxin-antitoxin system RelE/ParE family toxin [Saprospiraceae bacterium]
MNYMLIFHQLALEELQDAFNWYEGQRQGLGIEFMDAIDEVVQLILSNPASFPKAYSATAQGIASQVSIPCHL